MRFCRRILLGLLPVLLPGSVFAAAAWENIDWNKAERVRPGVLHAALSRTQPRLMKIHIVRVDLRLAGLRATATGRDPDWGKPMPDYPACKIATKRLRTKDFMAQFNAKKSGYGGTMIVAANAAPWSPWVSPYNHRYGYPAGTNILNGQLVSRGNGPVDATFVVLKSGPAGIVENVPEAQFANVAVAVGGFAVILRNGKILPGGAYEKAPYTRMVYGLSADRRYLYFLTVDGKDKEWSLGATGREAAELLIAAGAADGIDMDGGGSATLCVWDAKKQQPRVLNRQTKDGYTRPVGSNFGLYLTR